MPRRSSDFVDTLVMLPWWLSAGLGLLFTALVAAVIRSGAKAGGIVGGLAQGAGWVPWFILFIFGSVALCSVFLSSRKKELLERQTGLSSIRSLSWEAFESLVGEAYRRKGFAVEEWLDGGPDGGIDLMLRKDGQNIVVQCKQWRSSSVGVSVVREMYGVLMHERADRVIIITSGRFTREAAAFVAGKPLELVDGPALFELVRGAQTSAAATPANRSAPVCPKCTAPMVLRIAKRGQNAGDSFWGCSTYPTCRGTRSATSI
jgi:restriction system protein